MDREKAVMCSFIVQLEHLIIFHSIYTLSLLFQIQVNLFLFFIVKFCVTGQFHISHYEKELTTQLLFKSYS
jgi:hypothetical protein